MGSRELPPMVFILMVLLSSTASASTLSEYMMVHPESVPVIRNAYSEALAEFGRDPVFCESEAAPSDPATACRKFVRDQQERIDSMRFGQDWIQDSRTRPSPFGPILTYRQASLLRLPHGETCEGVLALPANSGFRKNLSFDLFCD